MPATELAANWLQRFHAGQDLPDGLAFRKALEQSGPDYTPDSLLRIDRLLRQIRRQAEPEFRAFLEPAPNRNFLFLLCFYVGGLVARYRLQTAQWYYRDELEGVLPAADIAALPADYGSSLVCTLWEGGECRAHFRPLAALVELLFGHPGAPNLLQTMDGLMQRCVQAPGLECPPPSARAAAPKPDQVLASALYRLGALAGAQLASACRRALQQGAPVEPLLRHAAASPALAAQGVTADGDDALVDAWRATQGQGAEQQGGSVLSYVTSLNLPRFRSTALALEACWLYPSVRVLVSVPYRAESQPGGFALHRPRVLEFSCRRELLPQFEAGFFAGMDSVKPPGLWAECFVDENHPDNIALRMAEQAAVQGWAPATALAVGAPTVPAADTENAAQTAAAVAAAPAARAATPAPAQATPKDPLAAVRLDDIDIAGLSAALPPADFAYPKMRMPEWIPKDPLLAVFDAMPALLRSGRVLWGYVVQAEAVLYKAGEQGATGEVVYDPSGRTPPAQLQEHAGKVAALRKELDPRRAAAQNGPPLLSVAAGELDEAPRIMGLAVPENISSLGLVLSSVYFERRHLPGGKLAGSLVPLLASDRHPGCVMLLPSRWWPDALLDLWRGPQRAEARKAWETSWTTLARAAAEADEAARAERKNAIAAYAADGVHDDHIAIMTATGHPGFTPNCKPRPREWEWGLDLELRGLARLHLVALERLRARGQAADWGEGRR
ncbi:MAG: hypothetical protein JNJ60_06995, partial [Rhodocyclaceae bacterium]|nr:hypothetical protein [Rhodocyclaceae bacterium]